MPIFERIAPVLPVRDVAAALEHYRRLGFTADAYDEIPEPGAHGPIYGFLEWGPVQLHLALVTDLDPRSNTSACYLYVDDTEALYAQWLAADVGGRLIAPTATPYGLREMAHIDPDGNLLRIGSPIRSSSSQRQDSGTGSSSIGAVSRTPTDTG